MSAESSVRDYQHCYGGDCKTCPRWDKCVEEYTEGQAEAIKKK